MGRGPGAGHRPRCADPRGRLSVPADAGRRGPPGAGSTSRPPPAPGGPRLSIVIPAYLEAERIGATIERVRTELAPVVGAGDLEVVVVDDGSSDGTADAARRAGADQVVAQPVNRGKGAAVRAGVLAATGRTVAFTDADLAYGPEQVARLLLAVEDGWDVVVGSRYHDDTTTVVRAPRLREVGGRVINAATRLVLVGHHGDTQAGLKAFRSDVAQVLFGHARVDGFAFDVELFLLVERYGFSLTEVPVEVENSDRSTVRVARDALRLLVDLARIDRTARRGAYDLEPGELDHLVAPATVPPKPGPAAGSD
ncbi:glycosyltransferase [Aquihabitans sp. G128]|uniref:glycosyltransferase n=1 Tax=Aquihabitans sp. G128 TaxID=2849779 RepID=UPI0020B4293B|nr:glycosyltransferase [Aquihabitans sp. G128]